MNPIFTQLKGIQAIIEVIKQMNAHNLIITHIQTPKLRCARSQVRRVKYLRETNSRLTRAQVDEAPELKIHISAEIVPV